MQTITLPNFIPTQVKGKFKDLKVTFNRGQDEDGLQTIILDEIFLEEANLTFFLDTEAKTSLQKEVSRLLKIKQNKFKENLNAIY